MAKSTTATLSRSQYISALGILRREQIKAGSSVKSAEKALAKLMHRLRAEGLSRGKIAARCRVSFQLVKWIFAKYPYGPDAEPIACVCGCGRTFEPRNGRRFYDRKRCRDRYIEQGGEVATLPAHNVVASHRQTYCHQIIEGEYIQCDNYPETCGVKCYREENGKPACFTPPARQSIIPSWYTSLFAVAA